MREQRGRQGGHVNGGGLEEERVLLLLLLLIAVVVLFGVTEVGVVRITVVGRRVRLNRWLLFALMGVLLGERKKKRFKVRSARQS